jgi:hypothetical protein
VENQYLRIRFKELLQDIFQKLHLNVSNNAIHAIMRLLTIIMLVVLVGCKSPTSPSSYWESQKGNFRYLNKNEFVSDNTLRADLRNLKMSSHPIFRQVTDTAVYLYSWQERDSTKNEFTVIDDEGEYGLNIYYYILDKKDSLISYEWIAGRDSEGEEGFMKRSMLAGKDTILTLRYSASGYDPVTKKKFVPDRSDSSRRAFENIIGHIIYFELVEQPETIAFINFWKDFSLKFKLLDTKYVKKHCLKELWFWGEKLSITGFFKNYYYGYSDSGLLNPGLLKVILDTNKTHYGTIGCTPSAPVKNAVRRYPEETERDKGTCNCWQAIIRDTSGSVVKAHEFTFLETTTGYKLFEMTSYTYEWYSTSPMVDTTEPGYDPK